MNAQTTATIDIDAYRPRLLAYACKRVQPADAEDVVQEAMLGFLASDYDGLRPVGTFLLGILSHKLADFFRRSGRRPAVSIVGDENGDGWQPMASTPAPDQQAMEAEETRRVLAAVAAEIESRGSEEGRIYRAVFVEGLDAEQTAAACGVTRKRVYEAKHMGIRRLRARLVAAE